MFKKQDPIQAFAFIAIAIFFISPGLISIPAMLIHRTDYQLVYYPLFNRRFIYPISALFAAAAIIANEIKNIKEKRPLNERLKNNITILIFIALVICMLISQATTHYTQDVNPLTFEVWPTRVESFLMQLGYFLLLFPAATLLKEPGKKKALLRIFEMVSLVVVMAAFVLWDQEPSNLLTGLSEGFQSIFVNLNFYGYYLSLATPLAAAMYVSEEKPGWRMLSLVALVCNTAAMALNNTLGAWIAGIFAMVFMIITRLIVEKKRNNDVLFAAAVFLVTLIVTGLSSGTLIQNFAMLFGDVEMLIVGDDINSIGSSRGYIWTWTLKYIGESPITGIGFEGVAFPPYVETTMNFRPHNEYLQYALFYGIPAGILYFAGCLSVYIRALKNKTKLDGMTLAALTSAFGYLVGAFFGLTVYNVAPLMFLMLGMGYYRDTEKTECEADHAIETGGSDEQ